MRVVLISTYDLGRQPFGLASPAAWLARDGADVRCLDLAVQAYDEEIVRAAGLVAFHLPMHTATRLAARWIARVRTVAPGVPIAAYGLYASMNETWLRAQGVRFVLGGEFEAGLASVARRLAAAADEAVHVVQEEPVLSRERLELVVPDRSGLPGLERYAHVHGADGALRPVGYTEASRGCKHRCRHCPIVPVYDGRFRVVPRDVVLADVAAQVARGARHVTFGDPDFWNGIGHALPLIERLHHEHPELTYDVTIKIEHLLRHREHLPALARTGCLFVTSAVESVDDAVLARLDKGHTRAEFLEAVALTRAAGLTLQPTFIPFTPWTTAAGYRELLDVIEGEDLVEQVAPVQLSIRLLVPAGSRLLELEDLRRRVQPFDPILLVHPWRHEDERVDRLQRRVQELAHHAGRSHAGRGAAFETIRSALDAIDGVPQHGRLRPGRRHAPAPVPYLTEPWYC